MLGVSEVGIDETDRVMLGGNDSAFQTRAVADVVRIAQNARPGNFRKLGGAIRRAVVDDEDFRGRDPVCIERLANTRDCVGNRLFLVECGDENGQHR